MKFLIILYLIIVFIPVFLSTKKISSSSKVVEDFDLKSKIENFDLKSKIEDFDLKLNQEDHLTQSQGAKYDLTKKVQK